MRKALYIVGYVVAAIAILVVAGVIVAQSSKFQTRIGNWVAERLEASIDGRVEFSKIHFKPFNTLVVKDLAIIDERPFIAGEEALCARGCPALAPVDTLLRAEYVIARFGLKGVFSEDILSLDKVHLKNGVFNLVIEDGRVNLQRIFAMKMDRKDSKVNMGRDLATIGEVRLENFGYTMKNYSRRAKAPVSHSIDWGDVNVSELNIVAHDVGIVGGKVKGDIECMSFYEGKGFNCHKLQAKVLIGKGQAVVEDMHVADDWSSVNMPYLIMSCPDARYFRKFAGQVRIDSEVGESRLDMRTVGFFAKRVYGVRSAFDVKGKVSGYVDDFGLSEVEIVECGAGAGAGVGAGVGAGAGAGAVLGYGSGSGSGSGGLSIVLSGRVKDINRIEKALLDLRIEKMEGSSAGVERVVRAFSRNPGIDLSGYAPGERFSLSGRFEGKLNSLRGEADVLSTIGGLKVKAAVSDLMNRRKATSIVTSLYAMDFNAGKLLGVKRLGECSLGSKLRVTVDRKEGSSLAIDSLMFDRLHFNGYDYTRLAAVGKVSSRQFDGKIISQDPALNFLFQGMFALGRKTSNAVYQFYANVGHADLHAMNIDKRETSNLSFTTQANFTKVKTGDILGNINVNDIVLEGEDGEHDIGDIRLQSRTGGGLHRISLDSELLRGSYIGTEDVGRFASDLVGLTLKRELPVLFEDSGFEWGGAQYDLDLQCVNTSELATFLNPDLYVDDNTSIGLSVYRNGVIDARVKTHRIALKDRYIKDLDCTIDNIEERLRADVVCGSVSLGEYSFDNGDVKVFADDNDVRLGLSYDNEGVVENRGDLYALGRLRRDERGEVAVRTEIVPSAIVFENNSWNIMESSFEVSKFRLKVDSLQVSNGEQVLRARGGVSRDSADSLDLSIQRFNIGFINNLLKGSRMDVGGVLSGNVSLRSSGGRLGYVADVVCDSTVVSKTSLGTVVVRSKYDREFSRYDIDVRSVREDREALCLLGTYTPASKYVDLSMDIDNLDIGFATPFLPEVFSRTGGKVTGKVYAEGNIGSYRLYSEGLKLVDTELEVAFTHVPYKVNGPVTMDEYGVYFDNVKVRDRYDAPGVVNGEIYYDHFKDIGLDLHIDTDKMELIDIPESAGRGFYGNVFGTGRVNITGPVRSLDIDVDENTVGTGKGDFHIPLSNSGENKFSNLLVFKQPKTDAVEDRYEELLRMYRDRKKKKSRGELSVHIRANATPDVSAHLELNKDTGNGLTGRGSGLIEMDVMPSKSYINYKGDYTLESGDYKFIIPNLVTKEFSIRNGSSIQFGGDLPESTLSIDAVYKTKASIATLISDTTSVNTRRAIECGINISDKLSNPQIKFSLDIPDLDPTVKSKVENALSTEDKLQRQFLALLITNNFLPDDASGITTNTAGILYSNVSEVMSRQINKIFERLDIPLDLGVKYQTNARGNDIFDVALSTQLFNNRVIVGGNLGNRQYNSNGSDIAGDLDIEVKIDRPGALRLNAFSHHSDQYTNYLDNLQRNGIGITYQKEFNSLGYLMKYMFSSRAKKDSMEIEEQRRKDADGYKTITIDANE